MLPGSGVEIFGDVPSLVLTNNKNLATVNHVCKLRLAHTRKMVTAVLPLRGHNTHLECHL